MNNSDSPAFPAELRTWNNYSNQPDINRHPGMTKREAFAMAAMQGLYANPNLQVLRPDYSVSAVRVEAINEAALIIADGQLAALEQPRDVLTDQEEGK